MENFADFTPQEIVEEINAIMKKNFEHHLHSLNELLK